MCVPQAWAAKFAENAPVHLWLWHSDQAELFPMFTRTVCYLILQRVDKRGTEHRPTQSSLEILCYLLCFFFFSQNAGWVSREKNLHLSIFSVGKDLATWEMDGLWQWEQGFAKPSSEYCIAKLYAFFQNNYHLSQLVAVSTNDCFFFFSCVCYRGDRAAKCFSEPPLHSPAHSRTSSRHCHEL